LSRKKKKKNKKKEDIISVLDLESTKVFTLQNTVPPGCRKPAPTGRWEGGRWREAGAQPVFRITLVTCPNSLPLGLVRGNAKEN